MALLCNQLQVVHLTFRICDRLDELDLILPCPLILVVLSQIVIWYLLEEFVNYLPLMNSCKLVELVAESSE